MAKDKIEDFGERIGGARKELTSGKAITFEATADWTEVEKKTFINKKNLFPVPNYKQMVEDGMDKVVAFYIKRVRDSLPTEPVHRYGRDIEDCREQYIEHMNMIKDRLLSLETKSDMFRFMSELRLETDIEHDPTFYNTKFYKAAYIGDYEGGSRYSRFLIEMRSKKFLLEGDDKVLADWYIDEYQRDKLSFNHINGTSVSTMGYLDDYAYTLKVHGEQADRENWQEGSYFFFHRKTGELYINFPDRESCKDFILKTESLKEKDEPAKKPRKTKLTPPQLEHIERTGEDYRDGKDITGEDMLESFGFKGGEFGNWESQLDRQTNLNMSYEAFKDLAKALDIQDKDVSLGEKLNIAYGSRGHGSALAHFEPARNVINLTKMKGAGSLAHEWGHALDFMLSQSTNSGTTYATDRYTAGRRSYGNEVANDIGELVSAMKYKEGGGFTKYFEDAKQLDKNHSKSDKGYWASNVEMFARAFACYVMDKLAPEKSDYLVGHAEMSGGGDVKAYPVGEDRERINEKFDKLIDAMKRHELLHTREEEPQKEQPALSEEEQALEDKIDLAKSLQVGDVFKFENQYALVTKVTEGYLQACTYSDRYCENMNLFDLELMGDFDYPWTRQLAEIGFEKIGDYNSLKAEYNKYMQSDLPYLADAGIDTSDMEQDLGNRSALGYSYRHEFVDEGGNNRYIDYDLTKSGDTVRVKLHEDFAKDEMSITLDIAEIKQEGFSRLLKEYARQPDEAFNKKPSVGKGAVAASKDTHKKGQGQEYV